MRTTIVATAVLALALVGLLAGARAAEPWHAKNLKVLPSGISKEEIKDIMKKQTKALGVDCDHCHAVPDMEKDTENKETARRMMTMVGEVNKKFFGGKPKVECMTCHRGEEKPKL